MVTDFERRRTKKWIDAITNCNSKKEISYVIDEIYDEGYSDARRECDEDYDD